MIRSYEDVAPVTKDEAGVAVESHDTHRIVHAMLGVTFYDSDWEWVQEWCLRFLESTDRDVRNTAITCLGHLARIHKKINKTKVMSALRSHLQDAGNEGRIEDAIDDIELFVAPATESARRRDPTGGAG
jgi:hypothetical protein